MKCLLLCLCVLATDAIDTSALANTVHLPAWEAPPGWEHVNQMNSSREGRFFMDDYLPALLSRTLVIDAVAVPKEGLRWILTGPRAGLTVEIRRGSVELLARWYDSFGLHPEGTTNFAGFQKPSARFAGCKRTTHSDL